MRLSTSPLRFAATCPERQTPVGSATITGRPPTTLRTRSPLLLRRARVCGRADGWPKEQTAERVIRVARALSETDAIGAENAERCNGFDEVWVPSEFYRGVYARHGVAADKLRVVPEPVSDLLLGMSRSRCRQEPLPAALEPLFSPGRRPFVFLSVFKWEERKNWRGLIAAFVEQFVLRNATMPAAQARPVALFIKTFDWWGANPEMDIGWFLEERFSVAVARSMPSWLRVSTDTLSEQGMADLYCHANAFALPSHGEGWGLPLAEAMAMGLPTIGTRWGGPLAFMNDANSFLVNAHLKPSGAEGMGNWAWPEQDHLKLLMAEVVRWVGCHGLTRGASVNRGSLVSCFWEGGLVARFISSLLSSNPIEAGRR